MQQDTGKVSLTFDVKSGRAEAAVGRVNRGLDQTQRKTKQLTVDQNNYNKSALSGAKGVAQSTLGRLGFAGVSLGAGGAVGLGVGLGVAGLVSATSSLITYMKAEKEKEKSDRRAGAAQIEKGLGGAFSKTGISASLISEIKKAIPDISYEEIGERGGRLLDASKKKLTNEELISSIKISRGVVGASGVDELSTLAARLGITDPAQVQAFIEKSGNRPKEAARMMRKFDGVIDTTTVDTSLYSGIVNQQRLSEQKRFSLENSSEFKRQDLNNQLLGQALNFGYSGSLGKESVMKELEEASKDYSAEDFIKLVIKRADTVSGYMGNISDHGNYLKGGSMQNINPDVVDRVRDLERLHSILNSIKQSDATKNSNYTEGTNLNKGGNN